MKQTLILAFTLITMSAKAQNFDVLKSIHENSPYTNQFLKSYPLSNSNLDELLSRNIQLDNLVEISLLANTFDENDPSKPTNQLILDILRKNKLEGVAEIFTSTLSMEFSYSNAGVTALKTLHSMNDKIVSLKLKRMLGMYFNKILNKKITKIDSEILPDSPVFNSYSIGGYVGGSMGGGPTPAMNELNDFMGQLGNSENLIKDAMKAQQKFRISELKNIDVILPYKGMTTGQLKTPYINGEYKLSTSCGSEVNKISSAFKIDTGKRHDCDPGNYSKKGKALFLPVFNTQKFHSVEPLKDSKPITLNLNMYYEMAATGGYACENYMGRPRNCKDYTSSVNAKIQGMFEIEACTDIYSCNIYYEIEAFKGKEDGGTFKVTLDGKHLTRSSMLRDEKHLVTFDLNPSISHSSGTGENRDSNSYTVLLNSKLNYFFGIQVSPSEPFDILLKAQDLTKEISGLNILTDRFWIYKFVSADTNGFKDIELATIYSFLSYINKFESNYKDPMVQRALRIIQQNLSNRAREIRENELKLYIEERVALYKNRYGVQNLYLNLLENIIHDESRMQTSFEEYESIIEGLLKDYVKKDNANFLTKRALLISLYNSEKLEKEKVVEEIRNALSELAQYQDLTPEQASIQAELAEK